MSAIDVRVARAQAKAPVTRRAGAPHLRVPGPLFALAAMILPLVTVMLGPFVWTASPLEQDLLARLSGPSLAHPLGAVARELMPTGRMASDTKNLLYYFRLTPDDHLLFGGRAQFAPSGGAADLRSARILRAGMAEVFLRLREARIDYAWGGEVGLTWDRLTHAGEHDGLYYSLGYNGHGVQMATYMGKQMVEVMTTGDVRANPWHGLSFPAVPLHFGPPWFLPFADAYYRVKDAVA